MPISYYVESRTTHIIWPFMDILKPSAETAEKLHMK